MERLPQTVEHDIAVLEGMTRTFLTYGVARLPRWASREKNEINTPPMCAANVFRRYLRDIAGELGRPFVTALEFYPWVRISPTEFSRTETPSVRITIPRRQYLAPLVAPLLILTDGNTVANGYSRDRDKSNHYRGKSVDIFTLHGEADLSYFEAWYERCRTDPAYRKALRLD